MRPIPLKLKKILVNDPYMKTCARSNEECEGRITWEHAFIYSGRQINEAWSIIPLCWYHHLGPGMNKRINEQIALSRATEEDLSKYPKRDWNIIKIKSNV